MRLVIRDLTKIYEKKVVFEGLSYSFETGKIYGLVGDRKSGKTTFFRCISGECSIDNGSVLIIENGMTKNPGYNDIEITYENPVLPDFMTGLEYIKYYMDVHKEENFQNEGEVTPEDYLKLTEISEDEMNCLIKEYSNKQKKQLQLVCNLISGPSVILLDTPFYNIDKTSASIINEIVSKLKENHIIIISTDNIEDVEAVCDEIVQLKDGAMSC